MIAFETKDVDDLLETGEAIGELAKPQYSNNGNVWTKSGAAYGRYNGFEALLFLKKADGGLQTDGDGNSITGSKTNLTSGLAQLPYEAQSGDRIELSYEGVKEDTARPYRGSIGLIIGERPLPLARTYERDRSNLVLTCTDESPEGWWDPKVVLSMAQTEINLPEEDQNTYGKTKSFSGVFQNKFALAAGSVTAGFDFFQKDTEMDYESYTNPAWNDHPDGLETVTADHMFVAATGYFGDWTINGKTFKTNII